ncbi:MAG: PrsW family intramembrane metalloprotease [Thermogemmatispora sp.]|uniref:PrsW family glutamic-type intramembrane protease n=1 Tax=Thermogemmatispora sp. TaxID=1968838 RepID=UPI0019DF806F|nr:PrsW family glutamic-type intramembrane protease [Thermogemmatispora sp.]MBE3566195.1 PrsW family intramembrane metalloprotease [Thermogemmatispora sp.]
MSSEHEKVTQASEETRAQLQPPPPQREQRADQQPPSGETPLATGAAPSAERGQSAAPREQGVPPASQAANDMAPGPAQFTYWEHAGPGPMLPGGRGPGWGAWPLPPASPMPPATPGYTYSPAYGGSPSYPFYPGYPPYANYAGVPPVPTWPGPGYWYPGYPPYPGYPSYPGYPAWPAWPGYSAHWQPGAAAAPQRPRDNYQVTLGIIGLICSGLALLAGLGSLVLAGITVLVTTTSRSAGVFYPLTVQSLVYTCSGLIGGGFCLYHSIRSLLGKPSHVLKMPPFWIFLIGYVVTLAIGLVLQATHQAVAFLPVTTVLIFLTAIFPALTLLTLGLHLLRQARWSTTWRRFTLALTSGATMGILFASLLELSATLLLAATGPSFNPACLNDPSNPVCQAGTKTLLIVLAVVVAPLVEETVKPLGVALLGGRLTSGIEAFILGMSAGIGFDLVETIGYISMGYSDWAHVALVRSGAGLLHGLGAGMVALGWYHLIRTKQRRLRLGFACWLYAVLQHALWNACGSLSLLPAPVGPAIQSWQLDLGFISFGLDELLILLLTIIFLVLFILIVRWLRAHYQEPTPASAGAADSSSGRPAAVGV